MLLDNQVIFWNKLNSYEKKCVLLRPSIVQSNNFQSIVKDIIFDVRDDGDHAILKYTQQFDKVKLKNLKVNKEKINSAEFYVSPIFKKSVLSAKKNIYTFHMHQYINKIDINTQIGVRCQQIIRPIQSVGLYVPGGTAPLTSTVLMLAIPAIIAGCKNIVLCSPPPISNEILYIAKMCGIYNVFQIGGVQAISAMGFGTNTVPSVNKIFGPGNKYVTEAKLQLTHLLPRLSVDMIAGPSELLIIADETANVKFITSDLLAQLEHGIDSQVIILTPSINILNLIILEIKDQISYLNRSDIILESLKNSKFILTNNIFECVDISNSYAPEHLILHTQKPRLLLKKIVNAGSIFLGYWSPEAVGDYASGTNHVLPTHGSAVCCSGLNVLDFQKIISVQELTPLGLKNISRVVETLCLSEHLDAHKNSVTLRVNSIKD